MLPGLQVGYPVNPWFAYSESGRAEKEALACFYAISMGLFKQKRLKTLMNKASCSAFLRS
jgi:hypothetical protein